MSKLYYDPEYNRMVTEDVIRSQYEWFIRHPQILNNKSYEEFRKDNFIDPEEFPELVEIMQEERRRFGNHD